MSCFLQRRKHLYPPNRDQTGAFTLLMTLILMILSTLIVLFAANFGRLQSKAISNIQRQKQAFSAAQAGLEFGINYLRKNSATIIASPSGGYISNYSDSNTSNVTLPDNSKYTITYTNPIANNYKLIKVSSTGTSDDGTATHTVSQLVEYGSMLLNIPDRPLILKGSSFLTDNSQVINTVSNNTIQSGSTTLLWSNAETILASGISSTPFNLKSDISKNDATISGKSSADLFAGYFGLSDSLVKSVSANVYTNTSNTDYSSTLSGLTGTSIFITQSSGTATIASSSAIGTATNPVIIVIKGNAYIGGNAIIYGYVYLDNPSAAILTDNSLIVGGVTSTGSIFMLNNARVMYSNSVLTNLQSQNNLLYYAKVPGSWKDF